MNYEELIEQFRKEVAYLKKSKKLFLTGELNVKDALSKAATAIETLMKELDELKIILDMYGGEEGITEAFKKAEKLDKVIEAFIPHQCSLCAYHHNEDGCEKELWALNVPNCEDWDWSGAFKRKW